jgi:tetratricopeptide (TPR) repeat protein
MRRSLFHRVFPLAAVLFCIAAGRSADDGRAIRDAVAAMDRGDFPSAERTLRAELQARPTNAAALSLLGAALDNQKKFPEADEFHRRAITNAPRDADVQSNYGNHLLMGAGDEKGAREAYLKATAIDPANSNANLQLARLALNQKNGPEALGYLKRLPAKQQEEPNAVVLRLQALYAAGDRAEGDALVERLSSTAQGDPGLSYSVGLALGKAGQFDKAETFLLRALAAYPSDIDVLYHAGIAASFAGDNQKARDIFETALRQQPKNVDVLYGLAWVDHALKQREAAILLLAQAAQIAPQRADVQKLLAITTAEVSALQDSLAAWDRYLKLEPSDDSARCERGLVAIRSGQFDEGMADLQWFIARHPGDATGYFYLGLGESGADQDQALKDIEKALALKPDLVEAHSARGYLYYQLGKPEGALADLEFAAAHGPDDPVTLDRLGQTYVALDRPADAVRVLRKAAELAPNESTTELHFARALADAGQTAEAAAAMDRFRQLGPAKSTAVPGGLVQYLSLTPEQRRAAYRARVEQAVAKEPSDADAQLRYLRLSLDDGKVDQAAAAARRIAGLKPATAVLAAAGRALLEANQYSLAKELLEQAAAAGPSAGVDLDLAVATFRTSGAQEGLQRLDRMPESARSGDYYLVRAQMLDASGKSEDAAAALDQALRAAPKRSDLYRQAAAFLTSSGKAAEAVRLLDRAASNLPGDREILLMKATTLEFALQTSDAENLLAEIERHWPEWPAIWVARGVAMATHGRFEEARQALETAISLGAHSPEVYFYLEKIQKSDDAPPYPSELFLMKPSRDW